MQKLRADAVKKNVLIQQIHLRQFDTTQDYTGFLFCEDLKRMNELLKSHDLKLCDRNAYKSWSTCFHITDLSKKLFDQRKT